MNKHGKLKFYTIMDKGVYNPCCDSLQFMYVCKRCGLDAGCYFCTFDPELRHDCDE